MLLKNTLGLALAGSLILAGSAVLVLQGTAKPQVTHEKTPLKKVPIPQSKPDSGKQMYKDYCAACHALDGKGNGPAVEYLKAPPADLTTMAKRNNGKFPAEQFASVLRFGTSTHPHGTSDMPIWGPLFRSQNKDVAELRIHNLSSFVEAMQGK
jgi:mono/diheme cytochrome c family protein